MKDSRYDGLDGLRGLAAFLVLLHHTALKGSDIGGLAVFLFFTLSGFLITGLLTRARRDIEGGRANSKSALARFWTQRALRIFPAYFFWLAVFLPFDSMLFGGQTLAHLGWYLVYAQNFLVAFVTHDWGDFTHTWSLAVEQQFYVLFPLLLLALPSRLHGRFLVAAILGCIAGIGAMTAAGVEQITLYTTPTTGFIFMASGGLLSLLPRARLAPFAAPGAIGATLAGLVLLAVFPMLQRQGLVDAPYLAPILGSALALFALMAATLAAPVSWPVRLLERQTPKFFGRISYALYIVHLPIAYWAQHSASLDAFGHGLARDIAEFVIVAPLSIALATLSFRFVESPFLRLKARMKEASTPTTQSTPALETLGQ